MCAAILAQMAYPNLPSFELIWTRHIFRMRQMKEVGSEKLLDQGSNGGFPEV